MKREAPKLPNVESVLAEPKLEDFPFVDYPETIYSVEPEYYFSICKEPNVIYRIKRLGSGMNESCVDYGLRRRIGTEDYLFRAVRAFGYGEGTYSLDYKSLKYGYALMGFNRQEQIDLEVTGVSFVHAVFKDSDRIELLRFFGAPASYRREDVDEARTLLRDTKSDQHSHVNVGDFHPDRLRNMLVDADIQDAKMLTAENLHSSKRSNVYAYKLRKAFDKLQLPYTVEFAPGDKTEVEIRKKETA